MMLGRFWERMKKRERDRTEKGTGRAPSKKNKSSEKNSARKTRREIN